MSRDNTNQPSIFSAMWASADETGAPDPNDFKVGAIGAASDGDPAGVVYHVTAPAGVKEWTDTGAVVANLYGA